MELKEHKFEIGIAVLTVLMIVGIFKVFSSFGSQPRMENANISYEMPRPKSDLVGEFGLGDREIDRRYVNPFAKKKQAQAAKPTENNVKILKPDNKKKKMAGQWMAIRKPQVKFDVVDRAGKDAFGNDSMDGAGNDPGFAGGGRDPADASPQAELVNKQTPRTHAEMEKFVANYKAGKIDKETYKKAMEELLTSNSATLEDVAVYGLGLTKDATSFALLARYEDAVSSDDIKAKIQNHLAAYAAPAYHGALRESLKSQDAIVVVTAGEVLLSGIAGMGREVRGEGTLSMDPADFVSFRAVVTPLSQNGNEAIREIAQRILRLLPGATV